MYRIKQKRFGFYYIQQTIVMSRISDNADVKNRMTAGSLLVDIAGSGGNAHAPDTPFNVTFFNSACEIDDLYGKITEYFEMCKMCVIFNFKKTVMPDRGASLSSISAYLIDIDRTLESITMSCRIFSDGDVVCFLEALRSGKFEVSVQYWRGAFVGQYGVRYVSVDEK